MAIKFNDLKKEQVEYIKYVYNEDMKHAEKTDILTKKFGVSDRTVRRWWEKLNLSGDFSGLPSQLLKARDKEFNNNADIVFFTAAQNKTGFNRKMLEHMESYKSFLEKKFNKVVDIVIAPSRYRNPTSPVETDKTTGEQWWIDELLPYIYYRKLQFGDSIIATSTRIRPTAKKPLTGYEVMAKDNHLVLPHPKIHFKTLPRFKKAPLRAMATSGYITSKNYSDSRAGETAWEHHSYGFIVLERKKDDTCHIPRNVKVNSDGSFIDLIYNVDDNGVNVIESSEGIVWGDIHAAAINEEIKDITLSLYDIFKPKKTVLHDIYDGANTNPHEVKDMFIQRRKIIENRYSIKDEIQHSFDIISQIKDTGSEINVVLSNHDVFLDRHINDGNWKRDLHNSDAYLEYALIQQTVDLRDYGTIYGYLLNKEFDGEVKYINYGESLKIKGYECGLHADNGLNGAKGSPLTFSKLNTKMIGAHLHSPIILDGYTGVGVTCYLDQYYTRKGISSWAYAHSVIHGNGKNQLLVFGDDFKLSDLI